MRSVSMMTVELALWFEAGATVGGASAPAPNPDQGMSALEEAIQEPAVSASSFGVGR